jgi:hypothetical protein
MGGGTDVFLRYRNRGGGFIFFVNLMILRRILGIQQFLCGAGKGLGWLGTFLGNRVLLC